MPRDIKAIAEVAGVPVSAEVAERIANSIGPAFEGFAAVAGTLPFDLEPATLPGRASRQGDQMSAEPALMSLTEVAQAISKKQVSSREVTQSCLDRIAQWQPRLNAFMAIEAEAALAAADRADASLAKGHAAGALHGVPMAHKDMYYDEGHVVTCGSKIRREFVATSTSTALQRLKDAGSVRLGSLQMAEFAYGPTGHNAHYGAVHNPFALDHITGGSSSGSGSAVAARLTFSALGSDTGGSIRMPAHFCGVTGLKTTVGRVSRAGAMPLSQSLDTVGPLARTVEDCALLLGLMAGADPAGSDRARRACAGLHGGDARIDQRPQDRRAHGVLYRRSRSRSGRILEETIAVLKREGAEIVKVELPDQRQLTAACQLVLATEAAAFHKRWLIERPQDYGPQVLMRLQNGLAIPGVSYLEAMRWRGPALSAHLAAVAGVDAVIAPVSPVRGADHCRERCRQQPRCRSVIQRLTRFTRPINYLGLPSLSIPSGFTKSGLPVGMQLIGRSFDEAMLLRIGAAFQRATDFHAAGAEADMTTSSKSRTSTFALPASAPYMRSTIFSFSLGEGEVLGLLGESGSGKSVTLRALMRLLPRKRTQISGSVRGAGARRAGAR